MSKLFFSKNVIGYCKIWCKCEAKEYKVVFLRKLLI